MEGLILRDEIDWKRYEVETDPQTKVRPAPAFFRQLVDSFGEKSVQGECLPWVKMADDIRFRPGEVSVWAGINGHGKSLMTGHVALSLMAQNAPVCIASMEMNPVTTLNRMARQASLGKLPTEDFLARFVGWGAGRLWLYDHQGSVDMARIAAVIRYCAAELPVKHVFVDSLMKVINNEDDYNAQKNALTLLTQLARDTGLHLHVVHHIRKGEDENRLPGKFDMKGSSSISDQADNVFIVWRNKKKSRLLAEGEEVNEGEPDALLVCEKQRNGEWEGKIALWFDPASQQYLGAPKHRPQSYVPEAEQ
jgi:twinkle protein